MALFKVYKGSNSDKILNPTTPGYITPTTATDGFGYYDTTSRLFYIDTDYGKKDGNDNSIIERKPLNANLALTSNNSLNGIFYGECNTATATKAKVASLVDDTGSFPAIVSNNVYTPKKGTIIAIKFQNASTEATMTLALEYALPNSNTATTTAIPLKQYGTTNMSSGTTTNGWTGGAVVPFVYNGSNWERLYWYNTTYSVKTEAENGTTASLVTTGDKYKWNRMTNNVGTVTSVQVQASSPLQSSESSAQSTSLNTTISFQPQAANYVLAGPTTGTTTAPTFRKLVADDLPTASSTTAGILKVSDAIDSTASTVAASSSAVKAAYDLAYSKTDTKVTQSVSTTSSWRKLLLHATADNSSTSAVSTATNQVYSAKDISAQPSTGTIRATVYNIADQAKLQFNSTTNAIDFVFV